VAKLAASVVEDAGERMLEKRYARRGVGAQTALDSADLVRMSFAKRGERIRSTRLASTSSLGLAKQAARASSRRRPARFSSSPLAGAEAMQSLATRAGARIASQVAAMPPSEMPKT
jgi:hypothetical protein